MSAFSPVIGIALAAYRPPPEFFPSQLESIRSQSFSDWICLISWDSPQKEFTDPSALQPFRDDPRFVWIENPSCLGHKKNFEAAIQAVANRGVSAIACSDQDDLWDRDKLARLWAELKKAPPLSLVHSDLRILEGTCLAEKTVWQYEQRNLAHSKPIHLLIRNQVTGCSMMMGADLARKYPEIPESADFHDHWYAIAASCHGGIYPIHEPLMSYRQHGNNVVGAVQARGWLSRPGSSGFHSLLSNCRKAWLQSARLAADAERAGMPLGWTAKMSFLKGRGGVVSLAVPGLLRIFDEPYLGRQALKRAVGCLFS